jgi:hypothetical protein
MALARYDLPWERLSELALSARSREERVRERAWMHAFPPDETRTGGLRDAAQAHCAAPHYELPAPVYFLYFHEARPVCSPLRDFQRRHSLHPLGRAPPSETLLARDTFPPLRAPPLRLLR